MEFSHFFREMCMYYCNHGTLMFANYEFLKQFQNKNRELPNESFQADLPSGDRLHLSPQKTKKIIEIFSDAFKFDHAESTRAIWLYNSKSLNARAINSYYELIKKYLDSRGNNEIYDFLNDHDWFKILYVLRQVTSHGGRMGKNGLEFPDRSKTISDKSKKLNKVIQPYPDTLTWQTISLTRGQQEEPEINEVNVSNLLSHILLFFTTNPSFNVGYTGNQTL